MLPCGACQLTPADTGESGSVSGPGTMYVALVSMVGTYSFELCRRTDEYMPIPRTSVCISTGLEGFGALADIPSGSTGDYSTTMYRTVTTRRTQFCALARYSPWRPNLLRTPHHMAQQFSVKKKGFVGRWDATQCSVKVLRCVASYHVDVRAGPVAECHRAPSHDRFHVTAYRNVHTTYCCIHSVSFCRYVLSVSIPSGPPHHLVRLFWVSEY